MDVIEKLIADHRAASESIEILRSVQQRMETSGAFLEDIGRLRQFFRTSVIDHFCLEELVLFPVIRKAYPQNKQAIIAEIEAEHAPIRQSLEYFDRAAADYEAKITDETRQILRDVSRVIIETLIDHAKKEDSELFSVIRTYFTDREFKEMEDAYFRFIEAK